ncbi:MAG: hypothetical protein JXB38_03480 [Anaerolineales bacterium]|nr:hypothetical protein [Anaerolineales bacterium]
MDRAKIYLINEDGSGLSAMQEAPYERETVLQEFLAQYMDLLPGDQISPENPRRWLLVAREMGVPGDMHETGRWSLDHLFLDQDGMPTFVECKRSADTRIRREVVAQMLDYAANGIEYWPEGRIREAAAKTHGDALDNALAELLDDVEEIDDFWVKVEENLQHGRVRLIFVADHTPRELRRLVEFLNEKMEDVEVLIVEIKQYISTGGQKALVPRVIGLTEAARSKKGQNQARTDRVQFLANALPEARQFFEKVLDDASANGYEIYWGTKGFSVRAKLPDVEHKISFIYGYPEDTFQFYFGHFDRFTSISEVELAELRAKLLAYDVFRESGEKTLSAHLSEADMERVEEVYNFILEKMDELAGKS